MNSCVKGEHFWHVSTFFNVVWSPILCITWKSFWRGASNFGDCIILCSIVSFMSLQKSHDESERFPLLKRKLLVWCSFHSIAHFTPWHILLEIAAIIEYIFALKKLCISRRKLVFCKLLVILKLCQILIHQNNCPLPSFFAKCSGLFEGALILVV